MMEYFHYSHLIAGRYAGPNGVQIRGASRALVASRSRRRRTPQRREFAKRERRQPIADDVLRERRGSAR